MSDLPTEIGGFTSVADRVALVTEARKLFGAHAARRLWFRLGLPFPDVGKSAPPSAPEIEEFLSTVLVCDPFGEIAAAEAYEAFASWARRSGKPVTTLTVFGRVMRSAGLACRRSSGVRYTGYRLPETPDPPPLPTKRN